MLAVRITDIKDFMNKLLIGDTFDSFCLVEASITTFNTFSIDGRLQRDFFDTDDCSILDQKLLNYSFWKEIRPFCYSVIRGKRVPLSFKIILCLSPKQIQAMSAGLSCGVSPEQVKGLYINIQFKSGQLFCTAGVSLTAFIPDKTLEHNWDTAVSDFLKKHAVVFEKM